MNDYLNDANITTAFDAFARKRRRSNKLITTIQAFVAGAKWADKHSRASERAMWAGVITKTEWELLMAHETDTNKFTEGCARNVCRLMNESDAKTRADERRKCARVIREEGYDASPIVKQMIDKVEKEARASAVIDWLESEEALDALCHGFDDEDGNISMGDALKASMKRIAAKLREKRD